MNLMTLLKRTLTKEQKKLFKYQRDNVPAVADTTTHSEGSDSWRGSDFDLDYKYDQNKVKRLLTNLSNFQPKSDLDRKLLIGIL